MILNRYQIKVGRFYHSWQGWRFVYRINNDKIFYITNENSLVCLSRQFRQICSKSILKEHALGMKRPKWRFFYYLINKYYDQVTESQEREMSM